MPGMRDLSVAVGKWVRRSHACTLMCFVTPLVDSVSGIFQRLSSVAWRWSNTAPEWLMRAAPRLGVHDAALRAWKSAKGMNKKSFLSPVTWHHFPCMEDWEGEQVEIGLVEVWPESCPRRPMHHGWGCGVGCEGLVDPRLLVLVGVLWVEMGPLLAPGTILALSCHQRCSAQKCLAVGGFLL